MNGRSIPRAAALALSALVGLAACGGSATPATEAPASAAPQTETPATPAPTAAPVTEAPASIVPGAIAYRVVNETSAPVDVYIRTQGLVTAQIAQASLVPGAVSTDLFPPDPGTVVVLPQGSGDPTCTSGCGFLAESSTNFGEGDLRILVVGADGTAPEFWANPKPASVGTIANALPPADPAQPLVIIDAGGMADAKFGLQVGFGGGGCVADVAASGLVLGGTNVLAYAFDPAGASLGVYPMADKGCKGAPVGGPFPIPAATAGSRTLLLLWGPAGAAQGMAMPLD